MCQKGEAHQDFREMLRLKIFASDMLKGFWTPCLHNGVHSNRPC